MNKVSKLSQLIGEVEIPKIPRTHNKFLKWLVEHPHLIENGFKVIKTNFAIGAGIIDIFGVDEQGHHCIVEIKTVSNPRFLNSYENNAVKQINRYLKYIYDFLELFGCSIGKLKIIIIWRTREGMRREITDEEGSKIDNIKL